MEAIPMPARRLAASDEKQRFVTEARPLHIDTVKRLN